MRPRLATAADLPALEALMHASIRGLLPAWLTPEQVEASFEIMGLDRQLVEDATYFAIEVDGVLAGCGGWSRRATMFGGDHAVVRDARLLDPATEPARIRAMYTRPGYERRGIGTRILELCEAAAASEGFRRFELVATAAGEPLYLARGFAPLERLEVTTAHGVRVPCTRMGKAIASSPP